MLTSVWNSSSSDLLCVKLLQGKGHRRPAKSHPEVLDDINKTGMCLQFHSPAEVDSHHNIKYTAALLNYIQLKVDIFINHIVLH